MKSDIGRKRRVSFAVISLAVVAALALIEVGTIIYRRLDPNWESPAKIIVNTALLDLQVDLGNYLISQYDNLYQEVCETYNTDWRLMSAIGYVESRFKPHAISRSGAVGLMQIMPRTGAMFGVTELELLDPQVNIDIANRHFLDIERMLDIPHGTADRDCIALILASYNGGIGHVFDAQRLARDMGGDPHKWSDVKYRLLSLRIEEVCENPRVRYGRFRGSGYTLAYVRDVMAIYDEYVAMSDAAPPLLIPRPKGLH